MFRRKPIYLLGITCLGLVLVFFLFFRRENEANGLVVFPEGSEIISIDTDALNYTVEYRFHGKFQSTLNMIYDEMKSRNMRLCLGIDFKNQNNLTEYLAKITKETDSQGICRYMDWNSWIGRKGRYVEYYYCFTPYSKLDSFEDTGEFRITVTVPTVDNMLIIERNHKKIYLPEETENARWDITQNGVEVQYEIRNFHSNNQQVDESTPQERTFNEITYSVMRGMASKGYSVENSDSVIAELDGQPFVRWSAIGSDSTGVHYRYVLVYNSHENIVLGNAFVYIKMPNGRIMYP